MVCSAYGLLGRAGSGGAPPLLFGIGGGTPRRTGKGGGLVLGGACDDIPTPAGTDDCGDPAPELPPEVPGGDDLLDLLLLTTSRSYTSQRGGGGGGPRGSGMAYNENVFV